MVKTENITKNRATVFSNSGCVLTRKYGYLNILKAKVGVRIIRGCVLYAENYCNKALLKLQSVRLREFWPEIVYQVYQVKCIKKKQEN